MKKQPILNGKSTRNLSNNGTTNGKSRRSRSRFGCISCKRKKIKCDESRPKCRACNIRGIECLYHLTLLFREDYESKGMKFGRENKSDLEARAKCSHYEPIQNPLIFLSFSYKDMRPFKGNKNVLVPLPPVMPLDFYPDPEDSQIALEYFESHLLPMFGPTTPELENVSLELLLSYASNYKHVYDLILAFSAVHLAKIDNLWHEKSQYFRSSSLQFISHDLEAIDQDIIPQISWRTDILVLLVLLVLVELGCGSDYWQKYLKLSKSLLTSPAFTLPDEYVEMRLLEFCLEFLHYVESMGRTICKDKNGFAVILDLIVERDKFTVITWMGAHRDLISAISDITDLSLDKNSLGEAEFSLLCDDIESKLNDMLQHLRIPLDHAQEDCTKLQTTFEIRVLSTILYFKCSLKQLGPELDQVKQAVKYIFNKLQWLLQRSYRWCNSLIWCMFMVAVELSVYDSDCEIRRYELLNMLNILQGNSWGDTTKVTETIMRVWKKRDLIELGDVNFETKHLSDWETFVADRSLNITLA